MLFANELDENAKKSLVALMVKMSLVDGIVEAETTLINQMASSLNLDVAEIYQFSNNSTINELCQAFTDRRSQVCLVIDLVNIACVDDDYTTSERAQIKEVCEYIGLSDSLFSDIETWVESGITWKKKGLELFGES